MANENEKETGIKVFRKRQRGFREKELNRSIMVGGTKMVVGSQEG